MADVEDLRSASEEEEESEDEYTQRINQIVAARLLNHGIHAIDATPAR